MAPPDPQPAQPSPALSAALRHALRPLIRVMLAYGLTLPWLTELIKSLLVEVAVRDFAIEGKTATDSRVSLLTGVHRKDVNRLRGLAAGTAATADKPLPAVSLGAQLAARWLGDTRYTTAEGEPRPLARNVSEGGEQSFEALVASLNSDIRSRVVLDEWLRVGVAHFDSDGKVCLNAQAFIPAEGFDEKAMYFGSNLHDHGAAAARNLLGGAVGEAPFFERSLQFTGLSVDAIDALAKNAQTMGMRTLLKMNEAAQRRGLENVPPDQAQRLTFGMYFYSEAAAGTPVQEAGDDTP